MRKKNFCMDCGKEISRWGRKCKSCENKRRWKKETYKLLKKRCGKNNPMFGKKRSDVSERNRKRVGENHPMFGKHHTEVTKLKISQTKIKNGSSKGKKNGMYGKIAQHGNRILYKNIYFRSSWESKFAKWLDKNVIEWEYENKTFDLLDNTTYTPDFYLPEQDLYIEIKGWWRDNAKEKFERFKAIYSYICIKILMKKDLEKIRVI